MPHANKQGLSRKGTLACIGLVAALAWYGFSYCFLPAGASTVSLLYAADAFDQCSRPAPRPDGPYWIPTAALIRAIDPTVLQLGREGASHYLYTHPPGYPFLRQYIGFTLRGERLVYVTVTTDDWRYVARMQEDGSSNGSHSTDEMVEHVTNWVVPEKPLMMCDGGSFNWGVVYHPSTNTIEPAVFNGGGNRVR